MVRFFYRIFLILYLICMLPKLLFQSKYRQSAAERLGRVLPEIESKKGKRRIWVHAVSVGETRAASTLITHIKKRFPDAIFVVTTTTLTGREEAKRMIPEAAVHHLLPLDFRGNMRALTQRINPDLVLVSESDYWLEFFTAVKEHGGKLCIINATISERSVVRYALVRFFSKKLFTLPDLYCVQSDEFKARFEKLGVLSDKIIVTGNLKYDLKAKHLKEDEIKALRKKLGLSKGEKVIAIGSTHENEEKMLMRALRGVDAKILLVPRHPERFDEVADWLKNERIKFNRYSRGEASESVILVDAMGVLRQCYQISDLAIVAGSFVPGIGGHNILEPLEAGSPVFFGLYMDSQKAMVDEVIRAGAGVQLASEQLRSEVSTLLHNDEKRLSLAKRGEALVKKLRGGSKRTWETIENHFFSKKVD